MVQESVDCLSWVRTVEDADQLILHLRQRRLHGYLINVLGLGGVFFYCLVETGDQNGTNVLGQDLGMDVLPDRFDRVAAKIFQLEVNLLDLVILLDKPTLVVEPIKLLVTVVICIDKGCNHVGGLTTLGVRDGHDPNANGLGRKIFEGAFCSDLPRRAPRLVAVPQPALDVSFNYVEIFPRPDQEIVTGLENGDGNLKTDIAAIRDDDGIRYLQPSKVFEESIVLRPRVFHDLEIMGRSIEDVIQMRDSGHRWTSTVISWIEFVS